MGTAAPDWLRRLRRLRHLHCILVDVTQGTDRHSTSIERSISPCLFTCGFRVFCKILARPFQYILFETRNPPSAPPLCLSTGHGIRTTFPVRTFTFLSKESPGLLNVQLAILACEDSEGRLLALILSGETGAWDHFTSGYDGDNGFIHRHDGIVEHRMDEARIRRRSLHRDPTKRKHRMRAETFPHSRQYPRLALLDSSIVDTWALGTSAPVLREICIPCYRLQSQSALAMYGSYSPVCSTNSFLLILPSWTLHHFRTIGITADGLERQVKQDEMHAVVKHAVQWHQSASAGLRFILRLFHTDIQMTVVIQVFACPENHPSLGKLHASVEWGRIISPPTPSYTPDPYPQQPEECDGDHISAWEDGKKCYEGPTDVYPTVTLQLSLWDMDDLSIAGQGNIAQYDDYESCYALGITLGNLPTLPASGGGETLSDAEL
ncbi:hypothetical protein C2E23DRAFT_739541 [Lenzites betulinus]|nr:hypothetical protein C2E23DRAFT_739541 [Lenzites betulinus]